MAASGFTPISLYYSTTASAVPTSGNLANGELGLNIADMKLYAKNSAGTVTLLASSGGAAGTVSSVAVSGGTTGLTTSGGPITTSGTITLAGTLATTNGGTGLTSFTSGGVVYASSTSALATGSALSFDGFGSLALSNNNSGGQNEFSVTNTNTTGYAALAIKNTGASGKTYEAGVGGNGTAGNYQNNFYIRDTTSNATFALNLNNIIFIPGGTTEVARFTSTGLGIGTSSPLARLNAYSASAYQFVANGYSVIGAASRVGSGAMRLGNDASYALLMDYHDAGVTTATIRNTYGSTDSNALLQIQSGILTFGTGTSYTERARISSAGGFSVGTATDPGAGLIADVNGNVRKVPQSGSSKTSSYTLATTDIGEYILLGASGAIVIPDATFAAGDVVSIFNNTGSTATITCSITTAYIAGTFTDKATMTLAAAGVATVLFITSTLCVVSGNVT